jgi:ubiquinone/menaquinone biosynthesis C-methylase UbiE
LDGTSSDSAPLDEGVTEYGHESMWRDTAMANAERARDLAARLERRAKAEDEVAARETYLTLLDTSAGERVLDVGCGSGAVTRDLARRVGERGLAVGLDPSPELLTVARGLAEEAGLSDRVEFREGNALRLPFPDRSFDVVVCATVLSHVPEGEAAIPELARVLRPTARRGVHRAWAFEDLVNIDGEPPVHRRTRRTGRGAPEHPRGRLRGLPP